MPFADTISNSMKVFLVTTHTGFIWSQKRSATEIARHHIIVQIINNLKLQAQSKLRKHPRQTRNRHDKRTNTNRNLTCRLARNRTAGLALVVALVLAVALALAERAV